MKAFGILLVIAGLIWAAAAFSMDTTVTTDSKTIGSGEYSIHVPSQTVQNLGLMDDRRNHLMFSGLTILAGVILIGFGSASNPRATISRTPKKLDGGNLDSTELDDIRALISSKGKTGLLVDANDARTIKSVVIDSPAYVAGIRTNDRIIMIDGDFCNDDIRDVATKLAGDVGTTVNLTIRRNGEALEFAVPRK